MKRTKKRNAFVDRLQFVAAWVVMHAVQWLPWSVAIVLGRGLGALLWRLGGKRPRRVLNHIRLVYGDALSPAERERLARASYRHFGLGLVEMMRQPLVTRENWRRYYPEEEVEAMVRAMGDGAILVSAHVGAYTWGAHVGALASEGRFTSVQRPLDNALVNGLMEQLRGSGGMGMISKFDSFLLVRKALNEGKTVALIVDQDGGKRGIFVDFLGTLASSWTSAAELHVLTRRPIIVVTAWREGNGPRQHLVVRERIEYEEMPAGLDKEGKRRERERRVAELTARIHARLGEAVRAHPEQWMWLHRRWKTRPPGEDVPVVDGVPCPWLKGEGTTGN